MTDSLLFLYILFFFLFFYAWLLMRPQRRFMVLRTGESVTRVSAELADSFPKKAAGLMFRRKLGKEEGMLFTFGKEGRYGFWMLFTGIPLEALCFSSDGTLVDIMQLEPYSADVRKPTAPVKYVLEVPGGFAAANGIIVGKTVLETGHVTGRASR